MCTDGRDPLSCWSRFGGEDGMDLDILRLRYLLGICWSKAQGKVWTGVRDLKVISVHLVVETVMEDEITQ